MGWVVAVVVWIVVASGLLRWHPLMTLFVATVAAAVGTGAPLPEALGWIAHGFGKTAGGIGLVLVFGAIMGLALERSGGAAKLASALCSGWGRKMPLAATGLLGFVVSVAVYCDSGFAVLSGLRARIAERTGASVTALSTALATGLYATHTLVPPTPGPVAAAQNLAMSQDALAQNTLSQGAIHWGPLFAVGGTVALLCMAAGVVYARYLSTLPGIRALDRSLNNHNDPVARGGLDDTSGNASWGWLASATPIALPVALIASGTLLKERVRDTGAGDWVSLLSNPSMALFLGALLALSLLKKRQSHAHPRHEVIQKGMEMGGSILLVTALGGALGYVLQQNPSVQDGIKSLAHMDLGLVTPFVVAALIKTSSGSSTVALVTTSALLQPWALQSGYGDPWGVALVVASIGSGSMTVSHGNDSYFWVVSQLSRTPASWAFRTHTLATLIQGLVGLAAVLSMDGLR